MKPVQESPVDIMAESFSPRGNQKRFWRDPVEWTVAKWNSLSSASL
jgi:hypothetical protein